MNHTPWLIYAEIIYYVIYKFYNKELGKKVTTKHLQ